MSRKLHMKLLKVRDGQADFDRIYALLNLLEGDEWNAKYWYKRIGLNYPTISIEDEMASLLDIYSIQ